MGNWRWRDDAEDQRLEMAAMMLNQQGEINELKRRIDNLEHENVTLAEQLRHAEFRAVDYSQRLMLVAEVIDAGPRGEDPQARMHSFITDIRAAIREGDD